MQAPRRPDTKKCFGGSLHFEEELSIFQPVKHIAAAKRWRAQLIYSLGVGTTPREYANRGAGGGQGGQGAGRGILWWTGRSEEPI